jgi:hypothetical protein
VAARDNNLWFCGISDRTMGIRRRGLCACSDGGLACATRLGASALLAGLWRCYPVLPALPANQHTFALVMLLGGLWLLTAHQPVYLNNSFDFARCCLAPSGRLMLARADGSSGSQRCWQRSGSTKPEQRHASESGGSIPGLFHRYGSWMRSGVLFRSLAPGEKSPWFIDYDDLYIFGALIARWWSKRD